MKQKRKGINAAAWFYSQPGFHVHPPEPKPLTLAQWLKGPGASKYTPILDHAPSVGIHDTPAIAHERTWLWSLDDYRVSSVQGGVIWLAPKVTT